MNAKQILAAGAAVVAGAALAVPQVSNVTMAQASGSRLVTITYDLSEEAVVTLDVQTNANTSAAADDPGWTSIGGAAISGTTTGRTAGGAKGDVWKKVAAGSGKSITWRPDLTWPDHKIADGGARAVVTAWALDNTPDYMAVDITATGGAGTQTYYPSADFVPGGVTNSLYKTTKLLMRKIMAKDVEWTMGSVAESGRDAARETPHQVTLTSNYYIGVYEITQTQWQQVTGYNPSYFTTDRAMRPVEKVSYTDIRQGQGTASTAAAAAGGVYPDPPYDQSFLGLLRTRTGLDFDLPSEAQWEFAARAGNGEGYWGDGSAIRISSNKDVGLALLGRYQSNGGQLGAGNNPASNCEATNATAIVGSYLPNAWGLYDMHGNVWELCLDWYEDNINAHGGAVNIDPSAPANTLSGASGEAHLTRGGSWGVAAGYCRPAYRNNSSTPTYRIMITGFRVLCSAGLR